MMWRSLLFGFATLVACVIGAWADGTADTRTVTPADLISHNTPLRSTDGQPRYAAQTAPEGAAPVAAPTTPVTVAPADAPTRYSTQNAPTQQAQQTQQAAAPALRFSPAPPDAPVNYASPAQERVTVTALRQSDDSLYRLGTGDKLHITVFNETDLSGDFTVDGQGFVRLPLLGQLQAAGLTSFALEGRISDAFTKGGYLVTPRVAVEITSYRPFYILGEVTKPGEYPYVNAMNATNAIALAGGFTDRAVQDTIYVRHQGQTVESELEVGENARIYPGDMIRVRRSTYWTVMTWLSPIISPFATVAYLLK